MPAPSAPEEEAAGSSVRNDEDQFEREWERVVAGGAGQAGPGGKACRHRAVDSDADDADEGKGRREKQYLEDASEVAVVSDTTACASCVDVDRVGL